MWVKESEPRTYFVLRYNLVLRRPISKEEKQNLYIRRGTKEVHVKFLCLASRNSHYDFSTLGVSFLIKTFALCYTDDIISHLLGYAMRSFVTSPQPFLNNNLQD